MREINILDSTLRDGGLGLEDANINGFSNDKFCENEIKNIIMHLDNSNIEIIELGSIEKSKEEKKGYSIYKSIEEISSLIPINRNEKKMYVALFRGPDIPLNEIPKWSAEYVDGVRVIIRYSELEKSMKFCEGLAKKGYKVFVQPMLTARYTEKELNYIIEQANRMSAYALYFVDSYGYLNKEDVFFFFEKYNDSLKKSIKIGFHPHNNMNLAFSNSLEFIKVSNSSGRDIILDACAIGMGQGAGNLQTELISSYLNDQYNKKYDFKEILEICEIVEKHLVNSLWGYSITRMLPAIYKTAYKYAMDYRYNYKLSYVEINEIFEHMPKEMKHRYTVESARDLVKKKG